ncbi:MAG: 13E12 repeat family protein, partial [Propionibacteriaceae bacterium]|nr:13E12 repeat family protein [Propionibacteriaceae bacterium]
MFDEDVFVETGLVLADPDTSPVMKLRAAIGLQNMAAAAEVAIIADMAKTSGWDGEDDTFTYNLDPAERCWVRVGADGVLLDEALPLEIAVAKHISVAAAIQLVKDIVDLSTRHPGTWKAVAAGVAPVWQARRVAQTLNRHEFTHDQVVAVDKKIAPLWGHYPWRRVNKALQAAVMTTTPQVAAQQAAKLAKDRFVHRNQGGDPASSYVCARLDTADAIFLDATVDRLADLLATQGDTRCKDHRRATALGVLATPALALSILGVHTRRGMNPEDPHPAPISRQIAATALPTCQVFVHLYADTEGYGPIARVEDHGPVLKTQLAHLVGHSRIRL